MKVSLNVDTLALREIVEFEKVTGLSISVVQPGQPIPALAIQGIVYVVQRRENPEFTFEDAGDITIDELEIEEGGNNPPVVAGKSSTGSSRRSATSSRPSRRQSSGR